MIHWLPDFRRKRTPPEPARAKFPLSWVTLIFTVKDSQGIYRNTVELFESELMAATFLRSAVPEMLEGFKGGYREIPDFLGGLDIAARHKEALKRASNDSHPYTPEHSPQVAPAATGGPDPEPDPVEAVREALGGYGAALDAVDAALGRNMEQHAQKEALLALERFEDERGAMVGERAAMPNAVKAGLRLKFFKEFCAAVVEAQGLPSHRDPAASQLDDVVWLLQTGQGTLPGLLIHWIDKVPTPPEPAHENENEPYRGAESVGGVSSLNGEGRR